MAHKPGETGIRRTQNQIHAVGGAGETFITSRVSGDAEDRLVISYDGTILVDGEPVGAGGGGGSDVLFAGYGPSVTEAPDDAMVIEDISEPFVVPALNPGDLLIATFDWASDIANAEGAGATVAIANEGLAFFVAASQSMPGEDGVTLRRSVQRLLVTETGSTGTDLQHAGETSRVAVIPTGPVFDEPQTVTVQAVAAGSDAPAATTTVVYAVTLEVVPAGAVALINPGA